MTDDSELIDRVFHIEQMKSELEELAGGEMLMEVSEELPPAMEEQFLEQMLAFEHAPETTHRTILARDGVELPPAEELDDDQLALKLIEVIQKLAEHQTYFFGTNHLSDREFYAALCNEVLDEPTPDLPPGHPMNCHIDLMQHGGEGEDVWLKYYADEETRAHIREEFPGDELPPHVDPPYDRDRHLPQPPPPTNPYDDPEVAAAFWTMCREKLERALAQEGLPAAPLTEEPEGWAPPEACIWKVAPAGAPDALAWWGICGDLPTTIIPAEGLPHLRDFLRHISDVWQQDADLLDANTPPPALRHIPDKDRPRAARSLRRRADLLRGWADADDEWEDEVR